jgi:hypothetical protein
LIRVKDFAGSASEEQSTVPAALDRRGTSRLFCRSRFAVIKFRCFHLIVHCQPPKIIRDLRVNGAPRDVSARLGKIDKLLKGMHSLKLTTKSPGGQ